MVRVRRVDAPDQAAAQVRFGAGSPQALDADGRWREVRLVVRGDALTGAAPEARFSMPDGVRLAIAHVLLIPLGASAPTAAKR